MIQDPDGKSVLRRYVAALQWTSRARTGDGRPYENGCIGVFTIRDGRIQHVREHMDTVYASATAFTGSVKPSPAVAGRR